MTVALDANLLAKVGTALYGARWQAGLARTLGKRPSTITRWLAGAHQPSLRVWRALFDELSKQQITTGQITYQLAAALTEEVSKRKASQPKPKRSP